MPRIKNNANGTRQGGVQWLDRSVACQFSTAVCKAAPVRSGSNRRAKSSAKAYRGRGDVVGNP